MADPKSTMDHCIEDVVSARGSLHTGGEDYFSHLEVAYEKSPQLMQVLTSLHVDSSTGLPHENHEKYVLLRNGAVSYIYLARMQSVQWF